MFKLLIFAFLLSHQITTLFAENPSGLIHLRYTTIDTATTPQAHYEPWYFAIAKNLLSWTSAVTNIGGESEDPTIRTYLFQLNDLKQSDVILEKLKELNIKIGHYIPQNAFIGSANSSQVQLARRIPGVKWVGHYDKEHKMPAEELVKKHMDKHIHVVQDKERKEAVGQRKLLQQVTPRESVEFIVLATVAPHDSKEQLQKQAQKWLNELRKLLGDKISSLIAVSSKKIAAGVKGSDAALETQKFLSKDGLVHWVEVKPPSFAHNKYAAQLVQSYKTPTEHVLWKRGLTGAGQVIGVGDTGLDVYHCSFYDDKNPVPYQRNLDEKPKSTHRKLAAFWEYMDKYDSFKGHGSHVAATAAGEAHPSLSPERFNEWNSLAYGAKLAFLDAGCDTDGGCRCPPDTQCECDLKANRLCLRKFGVVYLPLDLSEFYFPFFYNAGARVSSNSWGTGYFRDFSFGYSTSSSEIDEFVWKHKDFLPIFAAGNSGGFYGYASLTSESESKNALVIGASMSNLPSFQETINLTNYDSVIRNIKTDLFDKYCSSESDKDDELCAYAKSFDEYSCCDDRVNGIHQCPTITADCCGAQRFPDFKGIGFKCCKKCIMWDMAQKPNHYSERNVAHFTARGPALDGRIKPDAVTVGDYIVSAKSQGTTPDKKCSPSQKLEDLLIKHEGTSMAAPVAAAAAALVRQYFMEGYYPSGDKNPAVGFSPSAALVKAMLIHSTEILDGMIYLMTKRQWWNLQFKEGQRFSLKQPYFQGFGRIELNNVLAKDSGLYVPNRVDAEITTGELHKYCMMVFTAKKPLKITLVWSDYPSSPAAKINLVNDLDLIVVGPDKKLYFGNGVMSPIGSSRSEPDFLNNVEQLVFTGHQPGKYHIIVRGRAIPRGPQPYALVMSGDFDKSTQCEEFTEFNLSPELQRYASLTYAFGLMLVLIVPALCALSIYFYWQYKSVTEKRDGFRKTYMSRSERAVPLNQDFTSQEPITSEGYVELKETQPETDNL